MPMLKDPSTKYKAFKPLNIPNRKWPSKTIEKAPRWLATDLRDGNQSLPDPMSIEEKKTFFNKLIEIGYKEIEVAFPSASQIDFDFTRYAVTNAPDDVWIQVLSPCRPDLIKRTIESVKGAKKAIIHIYLATSECFRRIVFNMSEQESIDLAVKCTNLVRELTKEVDSKTQWQFEFSPETFSNTSPEFVIKICNEVQKAWKPSKENPIIFNLPATVEMSTPNVYADQIEYFSNNINNRQNVCISLHPHNDRGCAVAAAELAQLAGADRVEGCLFGNGERTGNVDLVTLALNLYTQGISPNIDFSDIISVIDVVEKCNKIKVPERAPYGGSLVVCAFSGSHQDAIKKGFQNRKNILSKLESENEKEIASTKKDSTQIANNLHWEIPYLPLDPKDIGRTYEAVIRVNSQSGKGGASWIILRNLELDLPRSLQVEFSKVVQKEAEKVGRELLSSEITSLFQKEYFVGDCHPLYKLGDYDVLKDKEIPDQRNFKGSIILENGESIALSGIGNGPISSFADAVSQQFKFPFEVIEYKEHALGIKSKTMAATYIHIELPDGTNRWGVGIHPDVTQASLTAILSAMSYYKQRILSNGVSASN